MSEDFSDFFAEPFTIPLDQIVIEKQNEVFSCFDCLGEADPSRIEVRSNGYYKSGDLISSSSQFQSKCGSISLFRRIWDSGASLYKHLDLLFKMMSKEIMLIEHGTSSGMSVFENNLTWNSNCKGNFKDSRFLCLDFLFFLHKSIKLLVIDDKYEWLLNKLDPILKRNLRALRRHLGRLGDLPDYVFSHVANSSGNKSLQASYHLVHLHLDIRWHYLVLLHILSTSKRTIRPGYSETATGIPHNSHFGRDYVRQEISSIVLELLELSMKRFEKIESSMLRNKSPFNCSCVQELWMLLIKLTIKVNPDDQGKAFWDIMDSYLDMNLLTSQERTSQFKIFQMNPISFGIFSFWNLTNISGLFSFVTQECGENYSLFESNLKLLLSRDVNESDLRTVLIFVEKLCLEIWEPKPETILILWEYFHKKLNNNFYVPGAAPSTLAVICKTPKKLIVRLKLFLEDPNSVPDSFQHFLRLIGLHLKKSHNTPRHWNLLRGRLYSKLTPNKLETLNSIGEYHFISLYLILAMSQDLNQIGQKMVELINSYYSKKKYLSEELIKGLLSLVLLLLESGNDASYALQLATNYIGSISILENIDVFRMYVETVQEIAALDSPLNLGQHLLIDKWISEYLSISSATDVSRLLDTLLTLLNRLKLYCDFVVSDQNIILMVEKLWDQLKSYLQTVSSQHETPYQVSVIAASLASISVQVRNKERFSEIVNMFSFHSVSDISTIRQFVYSISQNVEIINIMPNFDQVILKTWIKCCFLCSDSDHIEMKELTKSVTKIPDLKQLLGSDVLNLAYSSRPFLDFLNSLHFKYNTEDIWKKQSLREKVSMFFDGLDKWIKPVLSYPHDNGRIIFIYETVGQMFRLISPLIYSKSKPNTLLQQLTDILLLPIHLRNPESKILPLTLNAIKISLHLFIEGLLILDPECDPYIARVLKELILVYLPPCMQNKNQQLFTQNFLFIAHFVNYDNSSREFLLDVVLNNFLKRKARTPHPQAIFALKFIKELIHSHEASEDVMISILTCVLGRIFDVIMYCEEKSGIYGSAKEICLLIFNSEILRASEKSMNEVMKTLSSICRENLAWSSRQLFDLLVSLTTVAPDLVRRFTPELVEQVKNVEMKRGVGYDRTLRLGIERIEVSLRAIKDAT